MSNEYNELSEDWRISRALILFYMKDNQTQIEIPGYNWCLLDGSEIINPFYCRFYAYRSLLEIP